MSFLITGGMGAVGAFVARNLVERGFEPVLYSRHKNTVLISDIQDRVIIVEGDILDLDKLVKTIKEYKVERIIHAAAMLSRECKDNPIMAVRVNVEGTANVLEAAVRANVNRVVYTSAKGVYSEAKGEYGHPTYKPIDEDFPTTGDMGFYGLTKLFGEKVGFHYQRACGIDFIALRFSSTYGPGKMLKREISSPMTIHGRIIENAMLGKPTRHSQGGEQKDDFIYYKDVASGVVLACTVESLTHRVFNIGSGTGSTLFDFANAVKKIYPKVDIEIGPGLDFFGIGFNVYNVYDISRAEKELGFSPQYDFEKGVKDYVETLKQLKIEPLFTPT
jgi:UDP-glucose 4-epimerase